MEGSGPSSTLGWDESGTGAWTEDVWDVDEVICEAFCEASVAGFSGPPRSRGVYSVVSDGPGG